jgi:hypothetical protein
MKQWQVSSLSLLVLLLLAPGSGFTGQDTGLRFPLLYNANALAGRLYLQPLDVHDDVVNRGWNISFELGSATDYNVYFKESDGDEEWTVNSNIFSLAASRGLTIGSQLFEFGAGLRVHQDKDNTLLADLTESYHGIFGDGFGKTPPDGQYYGKVGNNNTRLIADSGDVFITTLQLSAKYQLLSDQGTGSWQPNLTLKLSSRIPLSGKDFDRFGIGLSAGLSKEVLNQFYLLAAAGIIYQDLSKEDFNADNLDVDKTAVDCFAGVLWDIGRADAWYLQLGSRWSSKRVAYTENSGSAESSWNVLFGGAYRLIRDNGRPVDIYLNFTEDIPGFGHGLEPDFAVYGGVSFFL